VTIDDVWIGLVCTGFIVRLQKVTTSNYSPIANYILCSPIQHVKRLVCLLGLSSFSLLTACNGGKSCCFCYSNSPLTRYTPLTNPRILATLYQLLPLFTFVTRLSCDGSGPSLCGLAKDRRNSTASRSHECLLQPLHKNGL
jgi:hypothetical protein